MRKPARPPAVFSRTLTRRQFLGQSVGLVAALRLPLRAAQPSGSGERKLRAAIIGHTGRGDYGHSHDTIFNGRENITVVAVADPDEAGRAKAAARAGALRSYADYHEMLKQEKPQPAISQGGLDWGLEQAVYFLAGRQSCGWRSGLLAFSAAEKPMPSGHG